MRFLRRKIYFQLKKHLGKPEISLILGPRQAGKTTLMLKLVKELEKGGKRTAYFSLDVIEDRQYFQTQHFLLDRLEKTIGRQPATVFIDEIQRLENAGLFLKGLYDLRTDYKFIVSGSGSLELKANILEPMTGRKKVFYCLPLSFTEFTANKLKVKFSQISSVLETNPFERRRLIEEYFNYGGYPRVILAPTHQGKIEILSEIYKSYLEKDIQLLLGVEKETAFQALVKILASQVGNLLNRAELSSTLGIMEKTVERYLYFLEKTFIIEKIKPFFRNVRKELKKSPKVYFLDLGFLNLARGTIPKASGQTEGSIFENACFLRLKELEALEPLRFWRSTSGAEVDFILFSPKTGEAVPLEAKITPGRTKTVGKSLISFLSHYKPKQAYIYTKERKATFAKAGVNVQYLPYFYLPML